MAHGISIYGFGSYYRKSAEWNDIDIVVVHDDLTLDSIHLALKAKETLKSSIGVIDVTILSASEEAQIDFVKRAKAIFLARFLESEVRSQSFVEQAKQVILSAPSLCSA